MKTKTPIVVVQVSANGISPMTQYPVTTPVEWRVTEHPLDDIETSNIFKGAQVVITGVFTHEMGRMCDSVKAVLIPHAGYENIDKDAVPPGCVVANVYEHESPIAEWVLMAMVALDHEVLKADKTFRAGSWEMSPRWHGSFRELFGQTLGLVGLGRIGMRVAQIANFLGMKCIAATRTIPTKLPIFLNKVVGMDRLQECLAESDFIVVCMPLTRETRGRIGAQEIASMKRSAYLINPSRGAIVDEKSLFEALRDGRLSGAAIDVWWSYPRTIGDTVRPSAYPFWELENVLMTPHLSGATQGTAIRRGRVVAANIDRLYLGEPLVNIVHEL